jgi:hypothetical protein
MKIYDDSDPIYNKFNMPSENDRLESLRDELCIANEGVQRMLELEAKLAEMDKETRLRESIIHAQASQINILRLELSLSSQRVRRELETRFPWLLTDDAASGADTVEALMDWYVTLNVREDKKEELPEYPSFRQWYTLLNDSTGWGK